jgi:2-polyprenyl-6-hydroxyphenyl methylase/3-demethylubiquinone-9 3-methyltransferase
VANDGGRQDPVRRNDLDLYERRAGEWWDERSHAFRSLHGVNRFRARLVGEWLGERLRGARVVDLGCGGGLLARAMLAGGASVVGIDLSHASLRAAREHLDGSSLFVQGDASRAPVSTGCADLVLLADILEHMIDPAAALREAARLLRPGGLAYVNTINRGWRARLLAVTVAEGLGLVPRGTHDPALFIKPEELERAAASVGLALVRLQGEAPDLLRTVRRWTIELTKSASPAVIYSALLEKRRSA